MTPATFVLNPQSTATFSNPLRKIEVTQGSLTVHQGEDSTTVKADQVYDCHNAAPHDLYSPDGANYAVTYSDEALPAETVASEKVDGAVNAKRTTKSAAKKSTAKK